MKSVHVPLKERAYKIMFGPIERMPGQAGALGLKRTKCLLVTTKNVSRAGYARRLAWALKSQGVNVTLTVLPNGESQKNLKTLGRLYDAALSAGLDRKSFVVALGGGVITDLAGFFAATYMRGIPYVSVPSTLLGMVDASVGGKTGVDLPQGKNLVGAFWQPRLVWIDVKLLKTLPAREWRTGFAEIIKYGVIKNEKFYYWLEQQVREQPHVEEWPLIDVMNAVYQSVKIKAQVVAADERETPLQGGREILNFGHTIGHALEAATGYDTLTHGEAISIGMVAAGRIALAMGRWGDVEQLDLISMFEAVGLPIYAPKLTAGQTRAFWSSLKKDKKHVSGRLRFVLPKKVGDVDVIDGISIQAVADAIGLSSHHKGPS